MYIDKAEQVDIKTCTTLKDYRVIDSLFTSYRNMSNDGQKSISTNSLLTIKFN